MWKSFGVLFVLAAAVGAQTPPDPLELAKQAQRFFGADLLTKNWSTLQLEAEMSVDTTIGSGITNHMAMPFSVWYRKPDHVRVEIKHALFGSLLVADGQDTYTYLARLKQYTKKAASPGLESLLSLSGLPRFDGNAVKSAKLLREEAVEANGKKIDCYVIEARFDGPSLLKMQFSDPVQTMWIDKDRHLLFRQDFTTTITGEQLSGPMQTKGTMIVKSMKFDEPIAESLFTFVPATDARQVERFGVAAGKSSDFAGKRAAEFSLTSIDEKPFNLGDMRGKVVLLDFWTTWCGPCRKEMPLLDRLYREMKDQGLEVWGVDVGEDRATVERFLKTSAIGYPILMAGHNSDVVKQYGATAFPTVVVVDREGKVASYEVGARGENALRSALSKAGLGTAGVRTGLAAQAGTGPAAVYSIGNGVSPPRVTYKRDPEYTPEARKVRVWGAVRLHLVVSPEGAPTQMTVVRPLGYGLDENALSAVSDWKFQPGMKEGKPVAVRATIEVNYRPLDNYGDPGWHAGPLTFHTPAEASRPVISRYVAPIITSYTVPENAFLELEFEVDESGRPGNVRVAKPSATDVDEAVRTAVAQWLFEPALRDGKPVMVGGRLQYVHGNWTPPPAP